MFTLAAAGSRLTVLKEFVGDAAEGLGGVVLLDVLGLGEESVEAGTALHFCVAAVDPICVLLAVIK